MKTVFISAELSTISTKDKHNRTAALGAALTSQFGKLNVYPLIGTYKGVQENSFMVHINTDEQMLFINELAHFHNQESILIVDNEGMAELKFMADNSTEFVGQLMVALEQPDVDCYSYNPATKEYYLTVK